MKISNRALISKVQRGFVIFLMISLCSQVIAQTKWTTENGGSTSVSLIVESVTKPDYD